MGDMKDAGDAPFRGEVQLDSKVGLFLNQFPSVLCQLDQFLATRAEVEAESSPRRAACHPAGLDPAVKEAQCLFAAHRVAVHGANPLMQA